MTQIKVLVVDDDRKLAVSVKKNLEKQGYLTDLAIEPFSGREMATEGSYDVIVLDVGLPVVDGFSLLSEIRASKVQTPVLMLTELSDVRHKLQGFEAGADDYMVKPFDMTELVARITALSRRKRDFSTVLRISGLEVDTDKKTASMDSRIIHLTAKEYLLLEYLAKNKERVISRREISEKAWNIPFDTGTNSIDVYINSLRKKIEAETNLRLIHTCVGMGYVMREVAVS